MKISLFNQRKNPLPECGEYLSLEENFERFFEWSLGIKHPLKNIPEIGDKLGFGTRVHSLGFIAVYLTEPGKGQASPWIYETIRANIYPAGVPVREDIHSHGFEFVSGIACGDFTNTRHYPDFHALAAEGEGYVGYQTDVDFDGNNHIEPLADEARIVIGSSVTHELGRGEHYSMEPKNDFHNVSAEGGVVTIFAKTQSDDISLLLRRPEEGPPEAY